MNKKSTEILALLLALVFSLSFAVCAFASEGDTVYDGADLLTDEQESELSGYLTEVGSKHGMTVALVTVDDYTQYSFYGYEEDTIQNFADDYYDNYFGTGTDGAVLAISMADRSWHISTSGTAIKYISDADIEYMGNEIVNTISEDGYYQAFNCFGLSVDEFMTDGENGNDEYGDDMVADYDDIVEVSPAIIIRMHMPRYIIASLIIGIIVGLIAVMIMKGKLKSVEFRRDASGYAVADSLNITEKRDVFLYSTMNSTPKPKDNEVQSGGSSVHISHSGGSHGGGGGHF